MTTSLYERIGGETAVMAAVDLFYQKVIDDELTRPFFDRTEPVELRAALAWLRSVSASR